jgi:hypothetical protein
MKKDKVIFVGLCLVIVSLFMVSFASAGFSDFIRKTITGKPTSETTTVNITINNIAPQITMFTPVAAQSVTENGITFFDFNFTVYDANGATDLTDASAAGQINRSGVVRTNYSCSLLGDFATNYANYTCRIGIQYFDGAGVWTINASITDSAGARATNISTGFTLNEDTCMVMAPNALGWGSLSITDVNTLSNTDPITINNTCNDAITDGNVKVTAIDLTGEETTTQFIYAGNFTVDETDACDAGPTMVNGTATGITGSTLPNGNHSVNDGSTGQEQLYFCLEALNPDLTSQSYSTGLGGSWTVAITGG